MNEFDAIMYHGEEVTVIGFDHGYVRVLGNGKETTVFIVNIDSGWDEFVDGKWKVGPVEFTSVEAEECRIAWTRPPRGRG